MAAKCKDKDNVALAFKGFIDCRNHIVDALASERKDVGCGFVQRHLDLVGVKVDHDDCLGFAFVSVPNDEEQVLFLLSPTRVSNFGGNPATLDFLVTLEISFSLNRTILSC